MKITKIEIQRISVKLPQPLTVSFHTFHTQESFYLRLHSSDELVGWGEGAPFFPITNDTLEQALCEAESLKQSTIPKLNSPETFYWDFTHSLSSPTLRAALDSAAHDLVAKNAGIPVYQLYCSSPNQVANSVTLFIQESKEATKNEFLRVLELYPTLRTIKIKLKGTGDKERCEAIKAVAPVNMKFMLDANQAFADPQKGITELEQLTDILGNVMLIEEPCRKGDHEGRRLVRNGVSRALVMADESCCGEADLRSIILKESADGVNIKLQKAGGITPARKMAKMAYEAGLSLMTGCMIETPLGILASLHFAASTDQILITDLDSDLELPDTYGKKPEFKEGSRIAPNNPGLGFSAKI